MEEEFKIYITYAFGQETDVEICKNSNLKNSIDRLMNGPFAMMGGIGGFKIVDSMDFLVMEVKDGKILWPRQEDI